MRQASAAGSTSAETELPAGPSARRLARADLVGAAIVSALGSWILLAAAATSGSSVGPIGTLLAATAAYIVARLVARRWPALPAWAVTGGVAILGASAWSELLDREPTAGPTGYLNADAALFALAFVASLFLVVLLSGRTKAVALAVAVALGVALVVATSYAALALAGAVVVAVALGLIRSWGRAVVVALTALLGCLLITIVLGATQDPRTGTAGTDSATGTRIALWHDALDLIVEQPLFGVGAGGFGRESPTAASDRDLTAAHHEYLQLGAESGVIGGLLLVLLFAWVIVRTGMEGRPAGAVVALGVAALAIHACVDYILQFPVVPVAAAILAGGAVQGVRQAERRAPGSPT
jgi:hypothetical protein